MKVQYHTPAAFKRVPSRTGFESASDLPSIARSPALAFTRPSLTLRINFLSTVSSHFQISPQVFRITRVVCSGIAPFPCPEPVLCQLKGVPLALASFFHTHLLYPTFSTLNRLHIIR